MLQVHNVVGEKMFEASDKKLPICLDKSFDFVSLANRQVLLCKSFGFIET